jgi:hypothetical protein
VLVVTRRIGLSRIGLSISVLFVGVCFCCGVGNSVLSLSFVVSPCV